jgi:hypothetical protein
MLSARLASFTPILETTQSEYFSEIYQYVRKIAIYLVCSSLKHSATPCARWSDRLREDLKRHLHR